jgi:maltose-binding protein MalE
VGPALPRRTGARVELPRRGLLGAAAALASAGFALSGCGSTAARLLRAAAAPVVLVWRPWLGFPNARSTSALDLLTEGIRPWLRRNPGVEVRLTTLGDSATATLTALVAGAGPDVFADRVLPLYVQADLLLDLRPYLRRDGVDLARFAPGTLAYLETTGRHAPAGPGLYALPALTDTLATAVNVGLLEDLGLGRPEPDWDWRRWTALWEAATERSSPYGARYGGQIYWSGYDDSQGNPAPFYLRGFGGEYVDPEDTARCILDAPGSVDCLLWAYGLRREGVVGGDGSMDFAAGRQATALVGTAGTLPYLANAWQSLLWDVYPMPVWPRGRLTYAGSDFYAVWAGTAYPDIAWDFVRFLCVDPTWQRWMMKLALVGPNQPELFPEWERVSRAVAPPLRDKHLEVFTEAVRAGEAYLGASFRYEEQASAGVIARYSSLAQAGVLSVPVAARRAAAEVNALQAGGAALQARTIAELAEVELLAVGGAPTDLPPPPVAGLGAAAQPDGLALWRGDRCVLLGEGAGLGSPGDACTFLPVQDRRAEASFTCRLTLLGDVNCPTLSPWASAGLMVRGDLGDRAATLVFGATAGRGLCLGVRPLEEADLAVETPGPVVRPTGLVSAAFLTRGLNLWAPNYLLQPIWLRLVRQGVRWTAYSSWDGRTWTQAAPPVVLAVASAWVGLYACAHNADFGDRFYVRAGFDHVSFRPERAYVLGRRGVRPLAGPVPPDWAAS